MGRYVAPLKRDRLLRPGEVADLLGVDPAVVWDGAQIGLFPAVTTPGGHARYRRRDVEAVRERIT